VIFRRKPLRQKSMARRLQTGEYSLHLMVARSLP
jgi:hypothetical protein